MPELRALLTDAGMEDVRTYVQSGNVIVRGDGSPDELAALTERLIAERFGLEIPVVARTRDELAEVITRDPFAGEEIVEKLYQVTFLAGDPPDGLVDKLAALATPAERFVAIGREWYASYPDGIARSKLAAKMAARNIGVTATARNWITVRTLLEMADDA
jgi:uncharacterized protein (DUF1697 family)